MGLIREPKGIDFYVEARPLTKQEEEKLNDYICKSRVKYMKALEAKRKKGVLKLRKKSVHK